MGTPTPWTTPGRPCTRSVGLSPVGQGQSTRDIPQTKRRTPEMERLEPEETNDTEADRPADYCGKAWRFLTSLLDDPSIRGSETDDILNGYWNRQDRKSTRLNSSHLGI